MILAAGMRNPAVRKRYLAAREVLSEFELLDFYESLLELQGSRELSNQQAHTHLLTLTAVFDETVAVGTVAHRFSSESANWRARLRLMALWN